MSLAEPNAVDWALRTSVASHAIAAVSRKTFLDRAAAACLAALFLVIALYTWVRPDYNWDMVAYIATALEDRHHDPVKLHAETWAQITPGARPAQLYEIQYGNSYNRHQWENPAAFQSQLSMFRVKVAYVAVLRALEPYIGLVQGMLIISIGSLIGIGWLGLRWLGEDKAWQAAIFLAPTLAIADLTHMATSMTPDLLLAFVSLLGIYWLAKGKDALACVALFVSVLVRPDNVILVFALLITAVIFGWRKLPMLITFLLSLAACVVISKTGEHPGWWAHFYFSCLELQNTMIGFDPAFSLFDMAHGYVRGILVALLDCDWPALFVVLMAAWALLARAGRMGTGRANALMFALAIATLGKFASFPLPDDRFYFVFIAGMSIILLASWKPRFDLALDWNGRSKEA